MRLETASLTAAEKEKEDEAAIARFDKMAEAEVARYLDPANPEGLLAEGLKNREPGPAVDRPPPTTMDRPGLESLKMPERPRNLLGINFGELAHRLMRLLWRTD